MAESHVVSALANKRAEIAGLAELEAGLISHREKAATFWGAGNSSSSDGQFFSAGEQGEAMNLINAKYGSVPGLKAYSHVSDQYAPLATQIIRVTVSERRKCRSAMRPRPTMPTLIVALPPLPGFAMLMSPAQRRREQSNAGSPCLCHRRPLGVANVT